MFEPCRCHFCGRELVPLRDWRALSPTKRKDLRDTHAGKVGETCEACRRAILRGSTPPRFDEREGIAYHGAWVTVGLIKRPTQASR